jgi:hypothetical protein
LPVYIRKVNSAQFPRFVQVRPSVHLSPFVTLLFLCHNIHPVSQAARAAWSAALVAVPCEEAPCSRSHDLSRAPSQYTSRTMFPVVLFMSYVGSVMKCWIHEQTCLPIVVKLELFYCLQIQISNRLIDRLCGLVVRVLGYRSGGPGSIPGTTRKKSSGYRTRSTQPREYN